MSFALAGDLKNHNLVHTGQKIYTCQVHTCDKHFSHPCYLKRHMITHSADKPHKCSICNKSFSRNSAVKRHMQKHLKKPTPVLRLNKEEDPSTVSDSKEMVKKERHGEKRIGKKTCVEETTPDSEEKESSDSSVDFSDEMSELEMLSSDSET
jgi:uncharacterized Zn-finger protein